MKTERTLSILIDADAVVYEMTAAVETTIQWDDEVCTRHADVAEAKVKVDDRIQFLVNQTLEKTKHVGPYSIILCFSDDNGYFRHKVLSTYKGNRSKEKPLCYRAVKKWAKEVYESYQRPLLEADDCLGILATLKPCAVIVSADKDFKQIPGMFYDYYHNELNHIDEQQADYWFYRQVLTGDGVDGYKGCPGIGPKKAEKLLDGFGLLWPDMAWDVIVKAYKDKGLTEEDALTQARVARILRTADYDFDRKEPILWTPAKCT